MLIRDQEYQVSLRPWTLGYMCGGHTLEVRCSFRNKCPLGPELMAAYYRNSLL
jgi:hypothetical protein